MKKQVEKWTLKQIVFVLLMMLMGSRLVGQTILFDVKTYNSGYNVSCHGYTDGSIQVTVVEGTYPFTYSWNTGATTPNLNNVGAGFYTLTVTDANAVVVSKTVELKEPDGFDAVLHPSLVQGGYNISAMGGHDGKIITEITGGTPPYTYAWSNNATSSYIENLGAGTYTVTINDQNTCAVTKTQVLTAPSLLHIVSITATNQNGHSVSCFGKANGSITTVVSGGVPPYTYAWDNGSFDQNPSGLKAGLYKLSVKDANNSTASGQITLTEPTELAVTLTRSNFGGYTISCNSCANGTINTSVAGGTSPFTYLWDGGQTNANRHNLGVGSYSVTVTDANGCQTTGDAAMTEPANAGWDFAGNAVDSSKFIGSSNNAPLIFKTNNAERMRISETGSATFQGNLKTMGDINFGGNNTISFTPASGNNPNIYCFGKSLSMGPKPCGFISPTVNYFQYLLQSGGLVWNWQHPEFMNMGYDGSKSLIESVGTPLYINTCGSDVYMCNATSGIVCIGCTYTNSNYKLAVAGKIIAEEVNVKLYNNGLGWPDYVFDKKYKLRSIEELKNYTRTENHLPDMPTAKEVETGGVNVSEMITKLLKTQEEQAEYIILLNEQNKKLEKEIQLLKNGK